MAPDSSFHPTRIIIHHSLTKDSDTVSWNAIRDYHIQTLGLADIGYHAGVELIRGHHEALFGRPWHIPGEHTREHNHDSLGICFIGNYDEHPPSDPLLITGAKVIRIWMDVFEIELPRIFTHNYFNAAKSCPGSEFDMVRLKNAILGLL
jgi:hypothetical protein